MSEWFVLCLMIFAFLTGGAVGALWQLRPVVAPAPPKPKLRETIRRGDVEVAALEREKGWVGSKGFEINLPPMGR